MLPLPSLEVVDRKGVIGILGEVRRVVEHDQRQDHLLERNPVHGDAVFGEVRRRIDRRAVLPDHFVVGRAEAIFRDGVRLVRLRIGGRRELGLAETGPHRRVGTEAMLEIDESFGRDRLIGARQVCLGQVCLRLRSSGQGEERE